MAQVGNGRQPDFFGGGMYQTQSFDIDKNAYYNDPNKQNNQQAQGFLQQTANRQAPTTTAAQLAPTATSANSNPNQQFRTDQTQLVNQLKASAAGNGPSLALSTLNQANANAAASRLSAAASERGYGGGAATNRNLAYQQGAANQINAINAANIGRQEQQDAIQNLGNTLSSARGQDYNEANLLQNNNQFNAEAINRANVNQAQFQQATNLANQEAQLKAMGYNDQQITALLGLSSNLNAQNQANQMAYNQLGVNQNNALQGIQAQAYQNAANNSLGGKLIAGAGGAAEGAAKLFAQSDEREKTTFSKLEADADMMEFLDSLGNHKYTYKNPTKSGADDKVHNSPMAQEYEKTIIGKRMVEDSPDGRKHVKFDGHTLNTIFAGLSYLNKKIGK